MRPNSLMAALTLPSKASGFERSATWWSTAPTRPTPAGFRVDRLVASRSTATTCMPLPARPSAIARPSPLAAPVTIATLISEAMEDLRWSPTTPRPATLETERARGEPGQVAPQRRAHPRVGPRADEIAYLVGIAPEVVELVELAGLTAVHPVDVLVAVGANGLVAHAHQPGHGVLGPVLHQERAAPADPLAREEG